MDTEKKLLTEGEEGWLRHMMRWGSQGYPVAKMGGKWWVNPAFGVGGCPSPFKTKTAAHAFCDRYSQLLLDKKAGRI
jgi:hypothetical protein